MTKMTGVTQACPASHNERLFVPELLADTLPIQPLSLNSPLCQACGIHCQSSAPTSYTEVTIPFQDREPLLPPAVGLAVKNPGILGRTDLRSNWGSCCLLVVYAYANYIIPALEII